MTLLLSIGIASAHAGLHIYNNTPCKIRVTVFAFDFNHPGCTALQSYPVVIGPYFSVSYNDVTALNSSPGWLGGVMATVAGGAASWGWHVVKAYDFTSSGGGVSVGASSCFFVNAATVPGGCGQGNVTVTWSGAGNNVSVGIN